MPRKKLSNTKNGYQSMLWTYESRREAIKQKGYPKERLKKHLVALTNKIITLRQAVKRFERKEAFMQAVRERIIEYNGIDVRTIPKVLRNKEKINTRYCFYKYCIENGIRGNYLGPWLGMDQTAPIRGRLLFTRSFKSDSENLIFWRRFSEFMKNKD